MIAFSFTRKNGGGFGGSTALTRMSAASAPDPNDAMANPSAAPTQAVAQLLKYMTLSPFQPLLLDPPFP